MSESKRGSALRRLFQTDKSYVDPWSRKQFGGTDGHGLRLSTFSPLLVEHVVDKDEDGFPISEGSFSYSTIYRRIPAVYTVVEFLAWQISQIGIKTYQRVSDNERRHVPDNPVERILANPAPRLTYERFMHQTVADLCVFGNAFWLKEEQGGERFLVPLPPEMVTLDQSSILGGGTYILSSGGEVRREIDADRIVHFRRYNPSNPAWGVSPLEPLRQIIAEESAASSHRANFWKNAARIELVLKHPQQLTEEAYKRLRADWQNTYAGARNAGKVGILEENMDIDEVSFSPKDSEFIEGRKLVLETVARAFNIPLAVLGLTNTATYASTREFHKALFTNTLAPWTRRIEGEIELGLFPWFGIGSDVYVEFNIEEKLRGSFEEQAEQLVKAVGGPYLTPDEVRALYNLGPIDGGDKLLTGGGGVQPAELDAPEETSPDEGRAAIEAAVRKFFARQGGVVASRVGSIRHKTQSPVLVELFWEPERWNAELAEDLRGLTSDPEREARNINQVTYEALLEAPDDVSGVFQAAQEQRATDIAWRLYDPGDTQ